MTKILERSRPGVSLLDFPSEKIETFLKDKLNAHGIQEAYLFGSYVQQKMTSWSDIDLLIVKSTSLPFLERSREFNDLFELGIPVDILVYTEEEFTSLRNEPSGFWRSFQEHHVRII